MKLGSILPYYGSKRSMASTIVEELGPPTSYWEPFCGSLAVILTKPKTPHETVCDLNSDLANLAATMADSRVGAKLLRELRRLPASEKVFEGACYRLKKLKPFSFYTFYDQARDYFIQSWLGRNGITGAAGGGNSFCVRYTPNGGPTATRWKSAVNSISGFRRRLRDVTILCRSAFDVLPKISDESGVVIYCDPPYLAKSKPYIHDFSESDHTRLAMELSRFQRARVVVSYYDHPWLATLYPGWTVRKLSRHKNMSNAGGAQQSAGNKIAPEVLLTNGPSYAKAPQKLLGEMELL